MRTMRKKKENVILCRSHHNFIFLIFVAPGCYDYKNLIEPGGCQSV